MEENKLTLERALVPDAGVQTDMWGTFRTSLDESSTLNPFALDPEEEARRRRIAQHKAWLANITHEYPSPYEHYRIGVYIRFFNQTKYDNYLDYHKQQFKDTIALCKNWTIVGFYVDEGQSAPNMENTQGWSKLLDDCFAGKIDLIITQKVSNVSRKPEEISFIARILASQPKPIGIYFISEDIFTMASYYQMDLHESDFIPHGAWELLPDEDPPFDPLPTKYLLVGDEASESVQEDEL